MIVRTRSADETRAVGAAVASVLVPGDVVLLDGPLGAGKTTFVQGLAAALDVRDTVTSPTFALVAEHAGRVPLAHVDCYRLESAADLEDLALDEPGTERRATVVEWADRFPGAFGAEWLRVGLADGDGPDERVLVLEASGARWRSRLGTVRDALHPGAG